MSHGVKVRFCRTIMETGDGRQKTGDKRQDTATQEIEKGDWDRRLGLGQELGDRNRRQIEVSKQETGDGKQETGDSKQETAGDRKHET